MTLRELMIERIRFCLTDEDLLQDFNVSAQDLPVMPDEDFLDLYDSLFTFQG